MRFILGKVNNASAELKAGALWTPSPSPKALVNVDLALEIAVRAAFQRTAAGGAAIALLTDNVLVCRARIGDIAPDLGMRLNVDSGMTGASVRSASTLHCEDAESDTRVDRSVCRSLGIRSILVMPVLSRGQVIGVVEILSARDHAFRSDHVEWLARLSAFLRDIIDPPVDKLQGTAVFKEAKTSAEQKQALNRSSHLNDEMTDHDVNASLHAILSALPSDPQSGTWDELSEALTSRISVGHKQ